MIVKRPTRFAAAPVMARIAAITAPTHRGVQGVLFAYPEVLHHHGLAARQQHGVACGDPVTFEILGCGGDEDFAHAWLVA